MIPAASNAKASQIRHQLVERFRSAGALSFQAAIDPGPLDRWQQRAFDSLARAGVLHRAGQGKWYLREDGLKDLRSTEIRAVLFAVGAALAAALIGLLLSGLGR